MFYLYVLLNNSENTRIFLKISHPEICENLDVMEKDCLDIWRLQKDGLTEA